MRAFFIALCIVSLSGCNLDSTLIIETPDDPFSIAEMCRNGLVYTIDKDKNIELKLNETKMVVCRNAPTSMADLKANKRWQEDGVNIQLTQYKDLL